MTWNVPTSTNWKNKTIFRMTLPIYIPHILNLFFKMFKIIVYKYTDQKEYLILSQFYQVPKMFVSRIDSVCIKFCL